MSKDNMPPVIEAEGTPYEIGFIHGSRAKKQIETSLHTYQVMFNDYASIDYEESKKLAKRYLQPIRQYDNDLLEELKGIADGSSKELEDILTLNARSEVMLAGTYLLDGCTSLGLAPELTEHGETLLAQNWDWKASQKEAIIILKIRQKNKPTLTMITEAGIIGKIGFNSAGLGLCINALSSNHRPEGVPLHLIFRGVLNSESLSDAIDAVGRLPVACPANFLIAHAAGEIISVEATPEDYDVIYMDDGMVAHTNHFFGPKSINIKDRGKLIFPDSFVRLNRINRLLRNIAHKTSIKNIQTTLADHVEYPDSICRHQDLRDVSGIRMETLFSIIINLSKKEFHLAPGPPCQNAYFYGRG